MPSRSRWEQAQDHERSFWERAAQNYQAGQREGLTFYKWRAENMMRMFHKAFPTGSPALADARVVEVGSGPVGMVAFLAAAERFALDPLCDFYATRPELIEYRNPDVVYRSGRGESIPYERESIDLVIIENVIDHVQDADGVVREIHRILKPSGILFLTVNLHPRWGAFLHRLVADLRIDRGHPHTFTLQGIRRFLHGHGFHIRYEEWEGYRECRRKEFRSDSLKGTLKAVTGLSEYLFSSVSQKT